MGTPSTDTVRRVVTFGRDVTLSDEEWVNVIEARRDQIVPLMKYMPTRSLLDIKLTQNLRGSELPLQGARIICDSATFKSGERGLFFSSFLGSDGRESLYWYWGLIPSGQWVRFCAYVVHGVNYTKLVDRVEVTVFDSTKDFLEKMRDSWVWIDLTMAVDHWVEHRQELLDKALEIQEEFLKQDALVAPFMRSVGDGAVTEFVKKRS